MRALIMLAAGLGVAIFSTQDTRATARLKDGAGKELGVLTLTQTPGGIQVTGTLEGLPDGEHGIHLHMTGSCEPSFRAAAGHWNPTNQPHGRHFGDLPNVTVKDGKGRVAGATPGGTLRGEHGLLDADGAAVIVHANADDRQSQPSGNSGDPIACGVVSEEGGQQR